MYVNKPRPFPQFTNFNYITNGAGHQYNSLDFEVKRRFASGLLYDFSRVWQTGRRADALADVSHCPGSKDSDRSWIIDSGVAKNFAITVSGRRA